MFDIISIPHIIIQQRSTFMLHPFYLQQRQSNIPQIHHNLFNYHILPQGFYAFTAEDQFCCLKTNGGKRSRETQQGKGRWTERQQECYIKFLKDNLYEIKEKALRKSRKVFLHMSRFVQSRTPDQCRSHHQKVLHIHKAVERIIEHYERGSSSKSIDFKNGTFDKSQQHTTEVQEIAHPLYTLTKRENLFRFEIAQSKISNYQ